MEVGGWPLVAVRTSLAAAAGVELVGARAGAEAPAWRLALDGRCGGATPRGVYQGARGAAAVGPRGALCGIGADGALGWTRAPGEVFVLGEIKSVGVFDVVRRGEVLEVWAASPSGKQLYKTAMEIETGAMRDQELY